MIRWIRFFSQGHFYDCASTPHQNAIGWISTTCQPAYIQNHRITHANIHKNLFAVEPVWFEIFTYAHTNRPVFAYDRHMMEVKIDLNSSFQHRIFVLCQLLVRTHFRGGETQKSCYMTDGSNKNWMLQVECNSFYEHVWLPNNSKDLFEDVSAFAPRPCVLSYAPSTITKRIKFYFVLSQSLNLTAIA